MTARDTAVMELAGLSISYHTEDGEIPAVRAVTLEVARGESLGLVGESGSGKTTLALGAVGYLPSNGRVVDGTARVVGTDTVAMPLRRLRHLWGAHVGFVSQNPSGALDPSMTVGKQLDEMGRRHLHLSRSAARRLSLDMLRRVEMPDPETVVSRYPHQLSGGMLQRSAIAMALLTRPALLILDEPTTALDVTTQAVVLNMLEELRDEFDSAILYITHNLGVVSSICDRVAVMYAGQIVEEGPVAQIFADPLHPYTANLLRCVPVLETAGADAHARERTALATIPGSLPQFDDLGPGCSFAPRCPLAAEVCLEAPPSLQEGVSGRRSACVRWRELLTPDGRVAALHFERLPSPMGPPRAPLEGEPSPMPTSTGPLPKQDALLEVRDAVKLYRGQSSKRPVRAVDGVSLTVDTRRTYGLVGESGSGKTTLARLVAGLTPPTQGRLDLCGEELKPETFDRSREVLKRLQMVFQSPEASLNPRRTVGEALERPLRVLAGADRTTARRQALALLEAVRLPASYLSRYPGELSGGEKQRVAIARAFAAAPDLVICDEPLSSLDVSVQGALMNLLVDLQEQEGSSYLFISHDLAAVQHLSHTIGVMYLGKIVEQGRAEKVLAPPYHPYTEVLVSAVPSIDPAAPKGQVPLRSSTTVSAEIPSGCPFHPRCPRYLGDICREQEPPWRLDDGRVLPAESTDLEARAAAADHALRCHIPMEELEALQPNHELPASPRPKTIGPWAELREDDGASGETPPGDQQNGRRNR